MDARLSLPCTTFSLPARLGQRLFGREKEAKGTEKRGKGLSGWYMDGSKGSGWWMRRGRGPWGRTRYAITRPKMTLLERVEARVVWLEREPGSPGPLGKRPKNRLAEPIEGQRSLEG